MNRKFHLLTFITLLLFISCNTNTKDKGNEDTFIGLKIQGEAQGTTYTIIYLEDSTNYQTEIDSILTRYDQDLSLWVPNSLLTQINNHERRDTVFSFYDSTKYFSVIFDMSREIWKLTDGAFDPSVHPLVQAWGFGLKNKEEITPELIDSLKELVGFSPFDISINEIFKNKYIYDRTEVIKLSPNVKLDFNAIAQGHSIDVVSEFLDQKEITNYMVEIGGELYCKGLNQYNKPWGISIDKPDGESNSENYQEIIEVTNKAVATSGSYRKFYEKDGVKYSHTIDPNTGYPVTHSLLSATVIADGCASADAYATAFMVMGKDKSMEFVNNNPELDLAIYLIYDNGGKFETVMSNNMKQYLKQ